MKSLCLERLGSLTFDPEDLTVLLFEIDTATLWQAITTFGSLKTIHIPEHLIFMLVHEILGPSWKKRG